MMLPGRRRRLNAGLHELRRPIQALGLALGRLPGDSPELRCARATLAQAEHALAELDAAVNRRAGEPRRVRVDVEELLDGVERRWLGLARIAVVRAPGAGSFEGDPQRLAAALDNLISNALAHGSPPVRVEVVAEGERLRLDVRDSGPGSPADPRPRTGPHHGHGLRIVEDVAAAHGGQALGPSPEAGGTVASLLLPRTPAAP